MSYSIAIREKGHHYGRVPRKTWWVNFTKTIREEKFGLTMKYTQHEWIEHRREMLARYNATFDGGRVTFENEQTATLFMLRWS